MRAALLIAAAAFPAILAAGTTAGSPPPSVGERAFQKCYSCHSLEPDRNDLEGPTLHDIVGRPIAAENGFDYSPALRKLAGEHERWTDELLDRFIADPEAVAPKTSMAFAGIADARERAALLDYLKASSSATDEPQRKKNFPTM